jgi:integrase
MVWSLDGTRHQRSLGRLEESEVEAALLEAWSSIDPSSIAEDRGGVQTLVSLCRAWYAHLEQRPPEARLADNTLAIYRRACVYIREAIGQVAIQQLSHDHIRLLVDRMTQPDFRAQLDARQRAEALERGQATSGPRPNGVGYGHQTINHTLTVLGMVLRWGRERDFGVPGGLSPKRYMLKARKGQSTARYRSYTPTTDEVQAFYDGLRRSPLRLAVLLGWRTGGRIGELGALRWRDIEAVPGGGFVRLDGKTGVRRVAISTEVLDQALSYQGRALPELWVFGRSFGRRGGSGLVASQKRQGIPLERQFTFHGLRRRWSADQIEAGVPINVYADQAGHSPEVALRHYAVVTDRERMAARIRVEARVGAKDVYAQLAERGLSVEEALALIDAGLRERVVRGEHLGLVE